MKNQINNLMVNSLRDGPLLEQLVILREKVTMKLKTVLRLYELKACDHKTCGLMKEEVLDCLHCLKISPKCVTKKYCFVSRQAAPSGPAVQQKEWIPAEPGRAWHHRLRVSGCLCLWGHRGFGYYLQAKPETPAAVGG
uniref:IZUMO family member 2 n=1 Tax=Molossus molossus TaxID=27622 RepID=A0A7J8C844_MOLMO|nr:IZUMO family member 2 [Molossus molossus]